MKRNLIALAVLFTGSLTVSAADTLKVFILAGQSNMVGHAHGHTTATLFNPDGAKDKKLIQMVTKSQASSASVMRVMAPHP